MSKCSCETISILIPAYNCELYIEQTVRSALDQSYQNVEVVVVDDGSSDETTRVLESIRDPRFFWFSQDNQGAASARNAAFAASSGRFVLYLDGDDVISAEHVAMLLAAINGSELDVAVGEWDRFHEDINEAIFPRRVTYQSLPGPDWCLLDWQYVNMTQCGMFLIPRSLVVHFGGWNPDLSRGPIDDFEFYARILSNCRMVNFAPCARLYYRSGIYGSLSTRRRTRSAAYAQLRSLEMGISHLQPYVTDVEKNKICAGLLQSFIYEHFPYHSDLRRIAGKLVSKFGGSNIEPIGPPGFHSVRRFLGWRLARVLQLLSHKLRLNRASRCRIQAGCSASAMV